jgi:hypothetical protein
MHSVKNKDGTWNIFLEMRESVGLKTMTPGYNTKSSISLSTLFNTKWGS